MTSKNDGEQVITVDFRLMEVRYELYALEAYFGQIEAQIESLNDMAIQRVRADLSGIVQDGHELETAVAQLTADERILMPRLVRHPFLVSLYAVYEAVVTEIAGLIGKQNLVELKLDDTRGEGFLDRAQKYYKYVLCEPCIPLTEGGASWTKVRLLAVLRNVIAHTNGKMDRVTKRA